MDKLGQEWVSAAVDGETDVQTMAELAADTHSHNKWRNYHLIGDAMRGELPQTMALDLSASIAAAIELEPAIVSPQAKAPIGVTEQVTTDKNRVVPLFKQFGQYAIAATVAMFAIVGVQNMNEQRRRINTYIQDHMLQQRLNTGAVVEDNSEVIPVPVNQ